MFKKYWNLLILFLSLYAVGEVSIEMLIGFEKSTQLILDYIDYIISTIFMIDFFVNLFRSNGKIKYIKSNWIDFLSSLPSIPFIKVLRVTKIFKILRGVKDFKPFIDWLTKQKVIGVLITYSAMLFIVVFYSSLLFHNAEHMTNNNVKNLFDSFWWVFTTLTSVGYGDIYPITIIGRVVAMFLTISGMGFFAIVTAEISTLFMNMMKKK